MSISRRRRHEPPRSDARSRNSKPASILFFKLPPTLGTKLQQLAIKSPVHIVAVELLVDQMLQRLG